MGTPAIERDQESLGRHGIAVFQADWSVADYDDLNEEKILDVDKFSGKYNQTFYAVEKIEWTAGINIAAKIYFDGVPGPDGLVLAIPIDATSGSIDFREYPQGCRPDPVRASLPAARTTDNAASNLVIDATGLPDDSLFLTVRYKEKGNNKP